MSHSPAPTDPVFRRIRDGSADAVAEFLADYRDELEEAARSALSTEIRRNGLNTEYVLATVGRRMLAEIKDGSVSPKNAYDLIRRVRRLANLAVVEYSTVPELLSVPDPDIPQITNDLHRMISDDPRVMVEEALAYLGDSRQRDFLVLQLRGSSLRVIMRVLDMNYNRAKKMAQEIRDDLREHWRGRYV